MHNTHTHTHIDTLLYFFFPSRCLSLVQKGRVCTQDGMCADPTDDHLPDHPLMNRNFGFPIGVGVAGLCCFAFLIAGVLPWHGSL